MSMTAFAQLNVQRENKKIEKVGTLRSTYAALYKQGSQYYLHIRTDNQFDKGCIFVLGENVESSIQTLKDLCELTQVLEETASVEATDAIGTEVLIIKRKMIGKPYLSFKMEHCAGWSNITYKELEKAIYLIKRKEGIIKEEPYDTIDEISGE
jgi:hypothetical protein